MSVGWGEAVVGELASNIIPMGGPWVFPTRESGEVLRRTLAANEVGVESVYG